MISKAVSNSSGLERWVMSPVWMRKAGFGDSAAMRSTAALMVALVSGLAGLLKPIWVSLIWTKVRPSVAAEAGARHAAAHGPHEAGARPGAAAQKAAPVHSINHGRLSGWGCIEEKT